MKEWWNIKRVNTDLLINQFVSFFVLQNNKLYTSWIKKLTKYSHTNKVCI